ncbi:MAG: catechol 1,2-dioxygenase, partial [Mesorhizobium sp.]
MVIKNESDLTPAVLAVMNRTEDPRLREILVAMVTHLHAFVREVRLTEVEFREATAMLNEIGQLHTDHHNE